MPTYQTDYYANNPANLITRMPLSIMVVPELVANIVIPPTAPFYAKDLELWYKPPGSTGSGTKLFPGVDYFFGAQFRSASKNTQLPIYSIIFLTDHTKNGSVELTHRTVGTEWSRDVNQLYARLIAQAIHPRKTTYENIAALPYAFPTVSHPHPVEEMYYTEDVIEAIQGISTAINNRPNDTVAQVYNLITQTMTKTDFQLGNVPNFSPSTPGEVIAGTSTIHFASLNDVSQIVERRLADMGFGGVTTPGGGAPADNSVTSSTPATSNEFALFDGPTGQVIKNSGGRTNFTAGINDTIIELKSGTTTGGVRYRATRGLAAGAFSIELVFPVNVLTSNRVITLPNANGTVMLQEDIQTQPGQLPFNSAAGVGLPSSSIPVSSAPSNGSVVRRDAAGNFTVNDPTADAHPVPRKYADDHYVAKDDTTVLRTEAIVQANAAPNTGTAYSTTAVQTILEDFVTDDELAQIIADLNNGDSGSSALTVVSINMNVLDAVYDLVADTFVVVTLAENGVLRFPVAPPAGSVIAIAMGGFTQGKIATVNLQAQILGSAATTITMRVPNEYMYFQYTSTGRWVRINSGEYVLDSKNSSSTLSRYRGSTAVLPVYTNFEVGSTLRLTTDVVVGDMVWYANSIIFRGETGWIYQHNGNTAVVEELYDILITGFTNINAAL